MGCGVVRATMYRGNKRNYKARGVREDRTKDGRHADQAVEERGCERGGGDIRGRARTPWDGASSAHVRSVIVWV